MFLDLAYHIVVLHIVTDFTQWSVLEFIFVFSYTYVRNPVWIETTVWLVLLYICHTVIQRKLQNVVYMNKKSMFKKKGEGESEAPNMVLSTSTCALYEAMSSWIAWKSDRNFSYAICINLTVYCQLPYMISHRIVSLTVCWLYIVIDLKIACRMHILSFTVHDQWSHSVTGHMLTVNGHWLNIIAGRILSFTVHDQWSYSVTGRVLTRYYHWPIIIADRILSLTDYY